MISASTRNALLAILIASMLVVFGAAPAFAQFSGNQSLYNQCHNGIDDDEDGFIDLLDEDCAQYRPTCETGYHSNEVFECVADEEGDPVCELPQVLVEHECVDPQPLECEAPQVANEAQTECVDPEPTPAESCVNGGGFWNGESCEEVVTCTGNQEYSADNNSCVEVAVPPTCAENQHLEGDVCVNNVVTPPAPAPQPTTSGGGGGGGGSNGPIAGTNFGGPAFTPSMGGSVLGTSTAVLPELPSGCTALVTNYMRMGKHNDPEQVKLLQAFLNKELGLDISVDGVFGADTDAAVHQFQMAHVPEILTPWGISESTGYVYKTTSRWINLRHCSSLSIPMPDLSSER